MTDGAPPNNGVSGESETSAEAVAAGLYHDRVAVGDCVRGFATVTIDSPDARNALNGSVRTERKVALGAIQDDDAVRVVVLTGADEANAFVPGADVVELREHDTLAQRRAGKRPRVYEVVDDLTERAIARVNDYALGGGCEFT